MNQINDTKREFEKSFAEGAFYNKQTQDDAHLKKIMEILPIRPGMKILDLGTGTGYLAFPLAKAYSDVTITGLDIVEQALQKNRERALQEQLDHLSFVAYGGITFPFEDHCFDLVITRYALHHFPMIEKTFSEIGRVLKPDGHLFLSDPTPNEDDHERFVDAYMQMKKDGHIKFYTKSEWKELADKIHMKLESCFDSEVRFPKKRNTALEFDDLLKKYDHNVIKGYDLSYDEEEIYLTERVNNLLFKR